MHVGPGAHLLGASHQDPNFAGVHGIEQVLLPVVGVVVMDECDLIGRDSPVDHHLSHFIVDGKLDVGRIGRGYRIFANLIQLFFGLLSHIIVRRSGVSYQLLDARDFSFNLRYGDRQVKEDKLSAFVLFGVAPDIDNVVNGTLSLATRHARQVRINQAHIERAFPGIGRDVQHVVFGRQVHHPVNDICHISGLVFVPGNHRLIPLAAPYARDRKLFSGLLTVIALEHVVGNTVGILLVHPHDFWSIVQVPEPLDHLHADASAVDAQFAIDLPKVVHPSIK